MEAQAYYEYYNFNGADFFTVVLKPDKVGNFPVVVMRSPYVSNTKEKTENDLTEQFKNNNIHWAENGYAIVLQHCRGQGKSSGDFIPYIHEREDGLALRKWIRQQDFYNGQLFLLGGSYTASLHYSTAPFEEDIKGAVFDVQDSERYRLWYRNGQMRRGHANWHFSLYKDKCNLEKKHTIESFSELPIKNLSQRVLGERAEDFEQMLTAERFDSPFWGTRFGGSEARGAVSEAKMPVLLTTGYNDFYVGGMFKMWNEMKNETREKCAMIVSPYNHGDSYDEHYGIKFPKGSVKEQFGNDYQLKWFNSIRKKEKPFVNPGVITYYRTFEEKWQSDFYAEETEEKVVSLSKGVKTLVYNPQNPPSFNPEGVWMKEQSKRDDVISIYTQAQGKDVFVKGKMKARLTVSSNCRDTSFYMMIGLHTEEGDYALRHDITSVCYQRENYIENEKIVLEFTFDEYAFAIKKGQFLRVDIAPTDKNTYVCHSNKKGQYSSIEDCQTAYNKIFFEESYLILPLEK